MRIEEWMQRNVVTAKPRDSILHARELMESRRVNQLPVVIGKKLVGIITDRDLRDAFPSALGPAWPDKRRASEAVDPAHVAVESVMTPNVMTLAPTDSLVRAARMMRSQRIGALPVAENGALVGMLTRSDVLEAFVTLVEAPGGGAGPAKPAARSAAAAKRAAKAPARKKPAAKKASGRRRA